VDNPHYAALQKILEAEAPDAVFTPWPIDNHPDHRAIANLTYEVSDGGDTMQFGVPTHYVDITAVAATKKDAC
jgi:hypothetical protein